MSIDLRPADAGSTVGPTSTPPRLQLRAPLSPRRSWALATRHLLSTRYRLGVVAAVQLACALTAVAISRLGLVHGSLRLDEAQSLSQTDHSYGAMLALVAQDVHVPGYHLLLRTWRLVFGLDVATARGLSLVFFVASIPVLYLVARRTLPTRWALLVGALFSLSPFMNWYGNEARMYTMLVFATLVSQLCFLRVLERDSWGAWVGYALAGMAGAYVHYFFVLVLGAQGVFFVVTRLTPGTSWRDRWRGLARLTGTAVLVAGALLPWLIYFRDSGAGSGTRPHLPSPSSVDFSNVYSQFAFGFQSDPVNSVLVATWPLLTLAGLASVRIGVRMRRPTAYFTVAAFGPVAAAFVASHLVSPFFLSRYMIAALPAVLIIVVAFVRILSPRVSVVLTSLALLATASTTVVEARSADVPVKEDYRGAARVLNIRVTPQDVVVVSSPFTIYPFEHYYEGTAKVVTLPAWDRSAAGSMAPFDAATLPQQVNGLAAGHQRIYLVLSYDQGYQDTIERYFRNHYEQIAAYDLSPGLQVVGFRVGYSQLSSVDNLQLSAPRR